MCFVKTIGRMLLTASIFLLLAGGIPTTAFAQANWPTLGWSTCTPEEQGFDSAKLAETLATIKAQKIDIHSLLIIRNGFQVVDVYFYPYDGTTVHELASVTKSIMTTLIAIAADQGKLKLDQPMVSFFPGRSIANRDERKERITVRHLAGMCSGLESVGLEGDEGTLKEMYSRPDWEQFSLDRKVVWEPGTHFIYDSPSIQLLSPILEQATGQTAIDFARKNLFEPLGIQDVLWLTDPQGHNRGLEGLYLHPRDAAKIGFLWLNQGNWNGKQIVSADWVKSSITPHMKTGGNDDYGYGWWITTKNGVYTAIGRGGQYIKMIPFLNAMVVTTGGGFNYDEIDSLLNATLIDPQKPLPANPAGMEKLNAAVKAVTQPPAAQPVQPLPEAAKQISGKTFILEPALMEIQKICLEFNDTAEAIISTTHLGGRVEARPVGLDGVYRMVPGRHNLPEGRRGYWADPQTFVLEYDNIANNDHAVYRLHFEGDRLTLEGRETAHKVGMTCTGRLQTP